MEIWKDIKGYKGFYQVSNQGRVRSVDRVHKYLRQGKEVTRRKKGIILSPATNDSGYLHVLLSRENKKEFLSVHGLVAKAFIYKEEEELEVNHIDGNKKNNEVDNLEWVTHQENVIHAFQVIHRENLAKNRIVKALKENHSATVKEIADLVGVTHGYVYRIKKTYNSNIS